MVVIITRCITVTFRIIKRLFCFVFTSFHLIFTTTLYGKYYYSHFPDETQDQGPWGHGKNPGSGFRSSFPVQCLSWTLSCMPPPQGNEKDPTAAATRTQSTGTEAALPPAQVGRPGR